MKLKVNGFYKKNFNKMQIISHVLMVEIQPTSGILFIDFYTDITPIRYGFSMYTQF
jgi:hypothetical protein